MARLPHQEKHSVAVTVKTMLVNLGYMQQTCRAVRDFINETAHLVDIARQRLDALGQRIVAFRELFQSFVNVHAVIIPPSFSGC
jgi:hypothetical protein